MLQENLGLGLTRTIEGSRPFADVMVFNKPITHHTLSVKEVNYLMPLYLYPKGEVDSRKRLVNFDPKLLARMKLLANDETHGQPNEVDVFDYIYGVLHSPDFRKRYAEFLKADFPRIPWPVTPAQFWKISGAGGSLRRLHLMEPTAIGSPQYPFVGDGDDVVGKSTLAEVKVWINASQYFDEVPRDVWEFRVGSYQPAQKWLKDREGRALSFEDVLHYQRILKVLSRTQEIMSTL